VDLSAGTEHDEHLKLTSLPDDGQGHLLAGLMLFHSVDERGCRGDRLPVDSRDNVGTTRIVALNVVGDRSAGDTATDCFPALQTGAVGRAAFIDFDDLQSFVDL